MQFKALDLRCSRIITDGSNGSDYLDVTVHVVYTLIRSYSDLDVSDLPPQWTMELGAIIRKRYFRSKNAAILWWLCTLKWKGCDFNFHVYGIGCTKAKSLLCSSSVVNG